LRAAPNVGVSILGEHHEHVCRQLASKDGDRFFGVDTIAAPSGSIYITESCAWFDCLIELEIDAGDHLIVVLRILQTGMSNAAGPLVFHRSRFRRLMETS
jgi:flavin reductase (DIM6/NTAB) family NADH-FMN oxidoreductase RutF